MIDDNKDNSFIENLKEDVNIENSNINKNNDNENIENEINIEGQAKELDL